MTKKKKLQKQKGKVTAKKAPAATARGSVVEKFSQSKHKVVIGGQEIAYTATAGTIVLKDSDEKKSKAAVFFIAYTRDEVADLGKRPVTFSFNGGPGSSSVWLHLGMLGPRRVLMDDDGNPFPPPYQLVDNECSLLDETDLVFIDPVSTGYSRANSDDDAKEFHNIEKDVESVGEFIRLYATRYKRWLSPKFLIGESYGTTRAAGLSGFLQSRYGMYLNGIMLVSSVLDFQTISFDTGNDLPYVFFLPTYAATAWYHKQLGEDQLRRELRDFVAEVEAFALGDYATALLQGDALADKDRQRIIKRLATYTGLSAAYIERTNLRLNIFRFVKELLRDQKRTVGRLDSRFKGIDRDSAGEQFEYDPSYATIQGTYTATFNDYVRTELDFESDSLYEILGNLYQNWDYGKYKNRYVNVAETLRSAICANPALKVFVANGYYDLATPHFATVYTFNHLGLEPSLRDNITMTYYEAGHMVYVHKPSLVQIKADLVEFMRTAMPEKVE